jgi:hypothetical protein
VVPYAEILGFVQQIAPTWCKPQHVNFARLIAALLARANLALSDLARAWPDPKQPLHGRLKRLVRFLDNPRLEETALFVRFLKLSYHFGATLPQAPGERPLVPLLLDTVYFEPFAMLVCTVPCGSRGLPVALTTYHRTDLEACFSPRTDWPVPEADPNPPRPRRHRRVAAAPRRPARRAKGDPRARPIPFLSQNQIEEELVDYVFTLLSSALHGVTVADRGFARASFFQVHLTHQRSFVIRFDAQTHIRLPQPLAAGHPIAGTPAAVLGIRPGERIWCPEAFYGKEEQVPIRLLAVWDADQKEPWYLASDLASAEQVELAYRWRMRLECANRDEKTGSSCAKAAISTRYAPSSICTVSSWLWVPPSGSALSPASKPIVTCLRPSLLPYPSRHRFRPRPISPIPPSWTRDPPIRRRSCPIAASGPRPRRGSSPLSPGVPSATCAWDAKSCVPLPSCSSFSASPAGSPPISGRGFPAGIPPSTSTASTLGGPPPRDKRGVSQAQPGVAPACC